MLSKLHCFASSSLVLLPSYSLYCPYFLLFIVFHFKGVCDLLHSQNKLLLLRFFFIHWLDGFPFSFELSCSLCGFWFCLCIILFESLCFGCWLSTMVVIFAFLGWLYVNMIFYWTVGHMDWPIQIDNSYDIFFLIQYLYFWFIF